MIPVTIEMVPELDAARVRRWAAARTPAEYLDEMRLEVDETPRGLTILDCRPPWSDWMGPEWIRTPVARLRYVMKRSEWTLYWPDRNSRFHLYELTEPTQHVTELLDEIDADPTCIFWG